LLLCQVLYTKGGQVYAYTEGVQRMRWLDDIINPMDMS